jgi:hypothetical protein
MSLLICAYDHGPVTVFDAQGDIAWHAELPEDRQVTAVVPWDEQWVVAVSYRDGDFWRNAAYLFDAAGTMVWECLDVLPTSQTILKSPHVGDDGVIFFANYYTPKSTFGKAAKVDRNGEVVWRRDYYTGSLGRATPTADGGFIIPGSSGMEDPVAELTRLDGEGEVVWRRAYYVQEYFGRAVEREDGSFVVIASSGERMILLYTFDSNGRIASVAQPGAQGFGDISAANDGGFLLSGNSAIQGHEVPVLYRLDEDLQTDGYFVDFDLR